MGIIDITGSNFLQIGFTELKTFLHLKYTNKYKGSLKNSRPEMARDGARNIYL